MTISLPVQSQADTGLPVDLKGVKAVERGAALYEFRPGSRALPAGVA